MEVGATRWVALNRDYGDRGPVWQLATDYYQSPLIEIIGVDVQGKVQAGPGKRAKEAAQVA